MSSSKPESGKWKSKLLSSSLPLEFEAMKTLVSKKYAITSDYSYSRNDTGVLKDFSVDIRASAFAPVSKPDSIKLSSDLLVECKHRHSAVRWLFFPDTNRADFSPITLGYTVRAIDNFSKSFFPSNVTTQFDEIFAHCIKGVEIDTVNGSCYDSEIRHGLSQLQFGLPQLIRDQILFNIGSHVEDNLPFLVCPILLTTAKLYVADRRTTIKSIEASTNLEDFAKPVPYLLTYHDYGPDFERHCKETCAELTNIDEELVRDVEQYRAKNGEYSFDLPRAFCQSLANGERFTLASLFTQFIVCDFAHFGTLLEELTAIAGSASRSLRKRAKPFRPIRKSRKSMTHASKTI